MTRTSYVWFFLRSVFFFFSLLCQALRHALTLDFNPALSVTCWSLCFAYLFPRAHMGILGTATSCEQKGGRVAFVKGANGFLLFPCSYFAFGLAKWFLFFLFSFVSPDRPRLTAPAPPPLPNLYVTLFILDSNHIFSLSRRFCCSVEGFEPSCE